MKNKLMGLKIFNAAAFLAMVTVNALAQLVPLGGKTTAEISAMYPTLLTPTGLTFSIWFLIYIAMAWFVIQQFFVSDDSATVKIGFLFILSCLFNIAWIISWHYQVMAISVISIAALWFVLLFIDRIMKKEKWHLRGGFTVYYAWITAATAVQLFVFLSKIIPVQNGSMPSVAITVGAIIVLAAFGMIKLLKEKDDFFGLTIAWAVFGVFLSQVNAVSEISGSPNSIVAMVSGAAVLLIVVSRIWIRPLMEKNIVKESTI